MSGCSRHFCPVCGEEMIHRDHRKSYESSSALGQIIWRCGPSKLSVMDADIVSRKQLKSGRTLLRFIEQKNKTHKYDGPQRTTLRFIDAIIRHCIECDDAESLRIDPKSGVYIIRGEIAAATTSRRETDFIGDQTIEHVSDPNRRIEITGGRDVKSMLWRFLDPDDYMKTRRNGSS